MQTVDNICLLQGSIQSLCRITGRRTSDNFASQVISSIIGVLRERYPFLEFIDFTKTDSFGNIVISSSLNNVEKSDICKAIEAIIRVIQIDLREKAGLYFLKEFKQDVGEDVSTTLQQYGVDLNLIQLEQKHVFTQIQKRTTTNTSLLGYSWSDVSNWKFDENNKVCILYDKNRNVLDQLNLDAIIKEHIQRLTGIYNGEFESSLLLTEPYKKEFQFLDILHSRDIDLESAIALLKVSQNELDQMIQRLMKLDFIEYSDLDVVKITDKGLEYLKKYMD